MSGRASLRQLLAILGLVVALVATVATSASPPPTARTDSGPRQISVDSQHALASQLFVVSIPANAAVGLESHVGLYASQATVHVDEVTAHDKEGASLTAGEAVSVRVAPVDAAAQAGFTPIPGSSVARKPEQLTISGISEASTDLGCEAPGPCDRAFRIIVTLRPGAADAVVTWRVEAVLTWDGQTYSYPSGAAATIRVDPPVVVAGSGPALDVSTDAEPILLGIARPALARLVELRYTPTAGVTYVPDVTLTVDVASSATGRATSSKAETYRNVVMTTLYLITDAGSPESDSPAFGHALGPNENPFAGCVAGQPCSRKILVSIGWLWGYETGFVWSMTAHRADFDRTVSETSTVVSLAVLERFDPSTEPTSHLHLTGDLMMHSPTDKASVMLCAPKPVVTGTGTAQPYRDLLPVAGSVQYSFAVSGAAGSATLLLLVRRNDYQRDYIYTEFEVPVSAGAGIFVDIPPGGACPVLEFGDPSGPYRGSPDPTWGFTYVHWILDVYAYSYSGLSYLIVQEPAPES
jgi:hypothetical protein